MPMIGGDVRPSSEALRHPAQRVELPGGNRVVRGLPRDARLDLEVSRFHDAVVDHGFSDDRGREIREGPESSYRREPDHPVVRRAVLEFVASRGGTEIDLGKRDEFVGPVSGGEEIVQADLLTVLAGPKVDEAYPCTAPAKERGEAVESPMNVGVR